MANTQLPAEVAAAAWNPNDKERDATTHASIVASFMASSIHKLSTGCNYDAIEYDVRSSMYHFDRLVQLILPTEYATKLHQEQQATEEKIDKALHAERNKQQKRFIELEAEYAIKLHLAQQEKATARKLLQAIYDLKGMAIPGYARIYNEIKTFLNGTK